MCKSAQTVPKTNTSATLFYLYKNKNTHNNYESTQNIKKINKIKNTLTIHHLENKTQKKIIKLLNNNVLKTLFENYSQYCAYVTYNMGKRHTKHVYRNVTWAFTQ